MSKQNTSSHQENKIFLSCSYTSREEFVREYSNFYYGKAEAKELYLQILTKLKRAVSVGNVDRFKNLRSKIGYISSVENQAMLKAYYYDTNYPIKNTNLVILASKCNKVEILKCIFEDRDILNNLSVDAIVPDDEDGTCHNAFYYAIRSGNVELLDTLINKWPDDYFTAHLEELENVLSKSYEELKLRNVPLTDEIEIFVQKKLISLRFFSSNSEKVHSVKDDINNIKERLRLLLENIRLLNKEYLNTNNVDERFLFIAKFIAQNVHILKRQLKSTYDRLPWEEIEFCLVSFISSHIKQQEINLFYRAALNKDKILNHLDNFAKKLEDEKDIECSAISRLAEPNLKREKNVEKIVGINPQFEELYNDYRQIRDAYSLEKMRSYIEFALLSDSGKKEGKLVISRCIQVIGEYLKNTLESPNLSNATAEYLLLSLSENARKIICDLRDSLSKAYSLFKRIEIEESSETHIFLNVQNDMKNIGIVIGDILHNEKLKVIKGLLEKISDSEDPEKIKETADILSNIRICDIILQPVIISKEEDNVEELIKELKSNMKEITNYEKEILNKVDAIMNSKTARAITFKRDYVLESMYFLYGNTRIDSDGIEAIRTFVDLILFNINPKVESNRLKEIAKYVSQIVTSNKLRVQNRAIGEIVFKIFWIANIYASKIKWIEELNSKLDIGAGKNKKTIQDKKSKDRHNYHEILEQRLFTLKDILNKNGLGDQLVENFSLYKKDRKLQSAVEMLVLDIMSILSSLENHYLENNQLSIEDNFPLLIGKCLRNHLAHGNALIDVWLSDPSMAVILNARKLTTENIIENKNKIGRFARDDPSKSRDRYNHCLVTITNQERMFIAIEEGNLEALKSFQEKGADINARRSTNWWTALHFAAKGSNLEVMKYVLDRNLNIDAKDINNQNPLHIATYFGSYEIAKFFIEDKGVDVNCLDNRRRTPTHKAAENGHKNVVNLLLENIADVNMKDLNGYTPLHYAVKNNHREIVTILLEKEKNVDNNKTSGDFTPLHIASVNNHLELVKFLLANKANVNAIGYNGWTPLHYIARSGKKSIAYALIENGADINAKSIGKGDTPLHIAAEYGNIEICKVLLNNKADVKVKSDKNSETALHLAAEGGYKDIVQILLHEGADVDAKDECNFTPLHLAALWKDNKEIVAALIKKGANINAKIIQGDTPLHIAAAGGFKGVVEILVNKLVDINIKNCKNETPLEIAVLNGHLQIVKTLLKHKKANLNMKGMNNFTVLHTAAHAGNFEIVKFLIETEGVDISAKTSQGDTALHLATRGGHKEVIEILLDNGSDVNSKSGRDITPLHISAGIGNLDIVKILLEKGANVNSKSIFNDMPLHVAASAGKNEIVKFLIEKGADVNIAEKDYSIPLHEAESIQIFLKESNVDVNNVKNINISTPIESAITCDHLQVVQTILRDKRVNINAKGRNGNTLLHIASGEGKLEIVKYLIEKGAEVNTKNYFGDTPLDIAEANGYEDIAAVLRANGADISIKDTQNRTAITRINTAAKCGYIQTVQRPLQEGADVNNKDIDGRTSFYYAINNGHIDVVDILPKNGADVTQITNKDNTSLHTAASKGHKEIVEILLQHVSPDKLNDFINAKTTSGGTASLHIAAKHGFLDIVKSLMKRGATYNIENEEGKTPFDLSTDKGVVYLLKLVNELFEDAKSGNLEIIGKLKMVKPDEIAAVVNVRDNKKHTLLQVAAVNRHTNIASEMLKVIKMQGADNSI